MSVEGEASYYLILKHSLRLAGPWGPLVWDPRTSDLRTLSLGTYSLGITGLSFPRLVPKLEVYVMQCPKRLAFYPPI